MKDTKIFSTNDTDLMLAADIIKNGGTVIFPTETVYGLGANAKDDEAVKSIFIAKGRPSDNPLIVHIDDFEKITKYVKYITPIASLLAKAYWPGPMTLILEKKDCISNIVSAGLNTVGIRIPENKVARKFLKLCDLPVAAPSANLSGSPSPTTSKHVLDDMMGRVDAIICGMPCDVGVESTVIDVTGDIPVILRPGGITPNMVRDVCGNVVIDKGINGVNDKDKPKSPGMKYRHYAPCANVILIKEKTLKDTINKMIEQATLCNSKVIVLCTEETKEYFTDKFDILCIGSRKKAETIAKTLFDAFRKCDDNGYDTIILEGIEEEGIGLAVMNRAYRAAHK